MSPPPLESTSSSSLAGVQLHRSILRNDLLDRSLASPAHTARGWSFLACHRDSPCVKRLLPPFPDVACPIHRQRHATVRRRRLAILVVAILVSPSLGSLWCATRLSGTLFRARQGSTSKFFNGLKLVNVAKSRRPQHVLTSSCHHVSTTLLPFPPLSPSPSPSSLMSLMSVPLSRPQWDTAQGASSVKTSRLQNPSTPQESKTSRFQDASRTKTPRLQTIKPASSALQARIFLNSSSLQTFKTPQGLELNTPVGCCVQVKMPQVVKTLQDLKMPQDLKSSRRSRPGPPSSASRYKTPLQDCWSRGASSVAKPQAHDVKTGFQTTGPRTVQAQQLGGSLLKVLDAARPKMPQDSGVKILKHQAQDDRIPKHLKVQDAASPQGPAQSLPAPGCTSRPQIAARRRKTARPGSKPPAFLDSSRRSKTSRLTVKGLRTAVVLERPGHRMGSNELEKAGHASGKIAPRPIQTKTTDKYLAQANTRSLVKNGSYTKRRRRKSHAVRVLPKPGSALTTTNADGDSGSATGKPSGVLLLDSTLQDEGNLVPGSRIRHKGDRPFLSSNNSLAKAFVSHQTSAQAQAPYNLPSIFLFSVLHPLTTATTTDDPLLLPALEADPKTRCACLTPLILALFLLVARAAPVRMPRLDPIPARPTVDDVMRRAVAVDADGTRSFTVDATNTADSGTSNEVVESGVGWATVRPRGCRLFLCL
ncbi:hypothetical protein C8R47DRAFT_1069634 [Mycena vitilis]|nr:hypothetical protein C8R47DRAFT_1069634 [Mycena vitilis]